MQIEIEGRPSFGMAVVNLDPGDAISAEAGAMVAMSRDLAVHTGFLGGRRGFFRWMWAAFIGLLRRWFAGESLFVNTFMATAERGGRLMLSPTIVGDVECIPLKEGEKLFVQAGSYLASTEDIFASVRFAGVTMWFMGEGGVFLMCRGLPQKKRGAPASHDPDHIGDVLINAYGAIERVEVDGTYVVDNGHVVAWSGDLTYRVGTIGGLYSTMFSGEGLVIRFRGKGTIWLQTRDLPALVDWVKPYFPK